MKCHMATHTVKNRMEERARSAGWRMLAGLQSCKGPSGGGLKKVTVESKEVRHPVSGRSTPRGQGSVWLCLMRRRLGAWDETRVQGPTMPCPQVRSLA